MSSFQYTITDNGITNGVAQEAEAIQRRKGYVVMRYKAAVSGVATQQPLIAL